MTRILVAIIIDIFVAIAVALLGTVIVEVGYERVGSFLRGVAGLLGLLAALYYYLTGQSVVK